MAYSHGTPNSIVTDGLVFVVDPANKRSWTGPDSSTVNNLKGINTGSISNDTSGSYGVNNSFAFDGTGDQINFGDISEADLIGTFTISTWVEVNVYRDYEHILAKIEGDSYNGWRIQIDTNHIRYQNSNLSGGLTIARPSTTNTWHNICYTSNGSNLIVYLDNISTTLSGYSSPPSTSHDFTIGDSPASQPSFNGSIGPTLIYDKELSASEVAQNYNALKGKFE